MAVTGFPGPCKKRRGHSIKKGGLRWVQAVFQVYGLPIQSFEIGIDALVIQVLHTRIQLVGLGDQSSGLHVGLRYRVGI